MKNSLHWHWRSSCQLCWGSLNLICHLMPRDRSLPVRSFWNLLVASTCSLQAVNQTWEGQCKVYLCQYVTWFVRCEYIGSIVWASIQVNSFCVGFTNFRFNILTDCIVLTLLVIQFNSSSSILRMCEIARYPRSSHHTGPVFTTKVSRMNRMSKTRQNMISVI